MPIDSTKYQQVLLKKEQVERIKKLSKKCRYPMTMIVSYAINRLLNDHEALRNLMDGKVDG